MTEQDETIQLGSFSNILENHYDLVKHFDIIKYNRGKHWGDTPKQILRSFLTCVSAINHKLHDSIDVVKREFKRELLKFHKQNKPNPHQKTSKFKIDLKKYKYHRDFDNASFELYLFVDGILKLNKKKLYKHFGHTDIFHNIIEILSIFEEIVSPLHVYTKYINEYDHLIDWEQLERFNELCETMDRLDSKNRIDELYRKLDIYEDFLENQDGQTKHTDKDKLPPDLMTLANVIKKYWATRVTLQRAITNGEITSYRLPKNKKHLVSEKEIAARFQKKP